MKHGRLIAFILVLAGLLGLAAFPWISPRARAVAHVEDLGGTVFEQDWVSESGPRCEVSVVLSSRVLDDSDLLVLQDMGVVHRVFLDGTKVTDAGLRHLTAVQGLEWVSCMNTAIGDEGLAHLGKIATLRCLFLRNTRVSDAGLQHLKRLPHLQLLETAGSKVTPAGTRELTETLPNLRLDNGRRPDLQD